ncbi:MAG: hypothetical protein AB8B94_20230, partial [Hyphomicrobiales bacterium]
MENTIENRSVGITPLSESELVANNLHDPLWAHKAVANHLSGLRDQLLDPTEKAQLTDHINSIWGRINEWHPFNPSTWGKPTEAVIHAAGWMAAKIGASLPDFSDIGNLVHAVIKFFSDGIDWLNDRAQDAIDLAEATLLATFVNAATGDNAVSVEDMLPVVRSQEFADIMTDIGGIEKLAEFSEANENRQAANPSDWDKYFFYPLETVFAGVGIRLDLNGDGHIGFPSTGPEDPEEPEEPEADAWIPIEDLNNVTQYDLEGSISYSTDGLWGLADSLNLSVVAPGSTGSQSKSDIIDRFDSLEGNIKDLVGATKDLAFVPVMKEYVGDDGVTVVPNLLALST